MTQQEILKLKQIIYDLKLNESYWNDLRHNSELLQKKYASSAYYNDDGSYVDIYDPDAYKINLFIIFKDNKLYLGNEQIPNDPSVDNKQRTANMIEYWFRGDNCNYCILWEFIGVHNKSISERGGGCNQSLLNVIKYKVIETIKTNLNVQNIGELDQNELKDQFGKIISQYKTKTRKLLKKTDIQLFADTINIILGDIQKNYVTWMNTLFFKNRFWFISQYEDDIKERTLFLDTFGHSDELYIAVLIIFKEYLLWQTVEVQNGHYWQTVFSKTTYIANPKCTTYELYDWKKLFDNSKPINMILSICYKTVYENKIIKEKSDFKKFRNLLYKNISIMNNDK